MSLCEISFPASDISFPHCDISFQLCNVSFPLRDIYHFCFAIYCFCKYTSPKIIYDHNDEPSSLRSQLFEMVSGKLNAFNAS